MDIVDELVGGPNSWGKKQEEGKGERKDEMKKGEKERKEQNEETGFSGTDNIWIPIFSIIFLPMLSFSLTN